jgi:predicted phage tail protein
MQFDAEQFGSIPTRGYEIKGVKVKVPSNYTAYDQGHCSLGGKRRKDLCEDAGGTWTGTAVGTTLYAGNWDGTFTTAWTCNPAWVFYDLCTEGRYGLGKWLSASQLDKWKLYEIAKYCDAVDNDGKFVGVSSGWGPSSNPHKEARFACNLYLQSAEEAYKVLNDIAAVFRGLLYWQEGMIVPVQDAPKDAVMTFGDANVIDGLFTYEGSSRKQRHNVALVTWNNPQDLYKQNVEYVEDAEAIAAANTQIFSTNIRALGCTSQSQARRVGKWLLYTEKYETEVCTFKTGLEGVGIRPGDLVKIADSSRAGVRYGGRVASGSTINMVQLDSSTPVISGKTYKLSLLNTEKACVRDGVKQTTVSSTSTAAAANKLIDTTQYFASSLLGTTITDSTAGTATVTAVDSTTQLTLSSDIMASGEAYTYQITGEEVCVNAHIDNEWKPYTWVEQRDTTTVTATESITQLGIPTAFTNVPTSKYMWILEEMGSVEAQDFRVLSVRESELNIHELSALKYHGAKYDLIENNIEFSAKSTSNLPDPSEEVPEPRDLLITEELYTNSRGVIKNRATFSWNRPYTTGTAVLYPYVASYYIDWRRTSPISNWTSMGETSSTSITIEDAPAGNMEFRVKTRRIF